MQAVTERVPGDVSAAAFWLVAGAIHPDAELDPPRRRRQPDPPRRHRHPALDGRRHRRATARRRARRRRRRAAGRPDRPLVRAPGGRARAGRRGRRDRRDPGPVPRRDGRRPARPSSAAPASSATRNPTGSPAPPPACARSARGSRSTATTSASPAATTLDGAETDSLDDHRLAMTFAIAGLVATRRDVDRAAGLRRHLLSRLLRRPRKGASMTKRVVLIGHPVAHSLSGAMQQAAFDSLGIDAKYELWDRAADGARRTRSPSCAATTSWAPTSRSRTRSGSCRWSTG